MTTRIAAAAMEMNQRIQSMTKFKQIIGRGTRINEDYEKYFFTIMDFKKATELFRDDAFDGPPIVILDENDDPNDPGPDEPNPDIDDDVQASIPSKYRVAFLEEYARLDLRDDPLMRQDEFRLLEAPADTDVTSRYALG